MANAQDEGLLDDDALRVAAISVLAAQQRSVVGAGEAIVAILFLALVAGRAVAAAIDHAADPDEFADLELGHLSADRHDAADDLVTGNRRVQRVMPFVAGGVQVGMTHAAIGDVDLHVVRTGCAPGISIASSGWSLAWAPKALTVIE